MDQLGKLCAGAKKVVILSDRGIERSGALERPIRVLKDAGAEPVLMLDLPSEPTCDQVQQIAEKFRSHKADCLVAIGGGSVMDTVKLCSVTVDSKASIRDLLNDPAGAKREIRTVMIPTTAGTGAEATPIGIVLVPEKN